MSNNIIWFPLIVAAISGMAMAFQGSANSLMSKTIGLAETTFIVLFFASILALASVFLGVDKLLKAESGSFSSLSKVPLIAYIGVPLSIVITWAVSYSIRSSGALNATTAILTAQIISAAIIDNFGWFGVEKVSFALYKLIGIALLIIGGYIVLR